MPCLPKGKCLCLNCGNTIYNQSPPAGKREYAALYQADSTLPIYFPVQKFGKSVKVEPESIQHPSDYSNVEITLEDPQFDDDFLTDFRATISYRRNGQDYRRPPITVSFENRICPICYRDNHQTVSLPVNAGRFDSYFIAELGRPAVGKTQFARAVSDVVFNQQRNSFLPAGSHFDHLGYEIRNSSNPSAAEPTPLRQPKQHAFLVTRKNAPKVMIYLLDLAGELLTTQEQLAAKASLRRILTNYCSAVFAFYDPRDIPAPELNAYKQSREAYDEQHGFVTYWADPLPYIRNLFSKTPPLAYILTGLDTLTEESLSYGDGTLCINGKTAFRANGLLSQADRTKPITATSVRERMVLSRELICDAGFAADSERYDEKYGWFVLSNGKISSYTTDSDNAKVDMDYAQGVIEPLAWVMNTLGIVKLREN